jgi:hypothetical protein
MLHKTDTFQQHLIIIILLINKVTISKKELTTEITISVNINGILKQETSEINHMKFCSFESVLVR